MIETTVGTVEVVEMQIEKQRMDRIGHKLSTELMQTNQFWPKLHVSARRLAIRCLYCDNSTK